MSANSSRRPQYGCFESGSGTATCEGWDSRCSGLPSHPHHFRARPIRRGPPYWLGLHSRTIPGEPWLCTRQHQSVRPLPDLLHSDWLVLLLQLGFFAVGRVERKVSSELLWSDQRGEFQKVTPESGTPPRRHQFLRNRGLRPLHFSFMTAG